MSKRRASGLPGQTPFISAVFRARLLAHVGASRRTDCAGGFGNVVVFTHLSVSFGAGAATILQSFLVCSRPKTEQTGHGVP